MKMSNNYKKLCLVLGLSTIFSAGIVDAANYTKSLKATYRDIQVVYNGAMKSLSNEPFLVDGSTYVPLRAVSEIMGASINWNAPSNTITITDNKSVQDTAALQTQLAQANYQNAVLQRELETVKAELANYKQEGSTGSGISTVALQKTLASIQDTFGTEERIDWEFDLVETSNGKLELTITYDSRQDESRFNRLSSSDLKLFVADVCDAIRANHKNIEIIGTISDKRSDWDKASFTYSKTDKVSFDLVSDNYYTTAKDLSRYYTEFDRIAYLGEESTKYFDLPIDDIELKEGSRALVFTVKVKLSTVDLQTKWQNIKSNDSTIEDILYDIQGDIEDEYDVDVEGELIDTSSGNVIGFIDSNGRFIYK